MRVFLLWSEDGKPEPRFRPAAVASRVEQIFAPLFAEPPSLRCIEASSVSVVLLELPVIGWTPPFFQEDDRTWALAGDYPLNARTVLRANGVAFEERTLLPELARALAEEPAGYLRELAPPFTLIWGDKATGEVRFQNDAMGQAQAFDYRGASFRALTNKVHALTALGVEPTPVAEHWAARLTLGWFPLDMTGYADVAFVAPGTQVRLDAQGGSTERHDVLESWVRPPAMSRQDCLDLGLEAMLAMGRDAASLWTGASVGLSGGWDSRTVTATLRHLGVPFSARVRGHPERYDVMIANELARIADFPIRTKATSGVPPSTPEASRESIRRALVWQAGYIPTRKHKTFLSRKHHLDGGVVNVMGQHGGFGKADFAVKIRADRLAPEDFEKRLLRKLRKGAPSFMRPEVLEAVDQVNRDAYRAADRYGLEGLARLHFFFLHEYTRRWSSGSLAGQTGLVYAPFMSPDFIRACYAFPPTELPTKPFHRYITDTLAPEWKGVPYTDEATSEDVKSGRIRPVEVQQKHREQLAESVPWQRRRPHKKYDYEAYWTLVGKPIIDEAMAAGGFWTSIFDPDAVREDWLSGADELAILHLLPEALQR